MEQPSPLSVFPSSHTSSPTLKPSPDISSHSLEAELARYPVLHKAKILCGADPMGKGSLYQCEPGMIPLYDDTASPFQVVPV